MKRTPGHTSPITVSGGTLELNNATNNVFTSALITVANGGTLTGNALATSVTVNKGGVLTAGLNGVPGKLRIKNNLLLQQGAIVLCQLSASANAAFNVNGNVTHNGDTILVRIPATRSLAVGDELTIFTVTGNHSGQFVVKVESENGFTYIFDASHLLNDGKLTVAAMTDGVNAPMSPTMPIDVYTTDGTRIITQMPYTEAMARLPRGTYILVQGTSSRKLIKN